MRRFHQLIGQVFPIDKLGDGVVQRLHGYLRPRPTRRHARCRSRAQLVLARSSGRVELIVEDTLFAPAPAPSRPWQAQGAQAAVAAQPTSCLGLLPPCAARRGASG